MFHRYSWGYLCVLAVMALAPFAGATAARASMGVLDQDALKSGYVAYTTAGARFQQFLEVRQRVFTNLQQGMGLSPEDYKEYERLAGHEVKIDAERIATFQEIAKKNVEQYRALQGKENPTDEEKAQLEKLDNNLKMVGSMLDEKRNKLVEEIRVEDERITTILSGLEAKAIEKIAQQKKLEIVLNRDMLADKEGKVKERFVLWGGMDITDDVIKLLNAEFKETMLDAPAQPAQPQKATPQPAPNK